MLFHLQCSWYNCKEQPLPSRCVFATAVPQPPTVATSPAALRERSSKAHELLELHRGINDQSDLACPRSPMTTDDQRIPPVQLAFWAEQGTMEHILKEIVECFFQLEIGCDMQFDADSHLKLQGVLHLHSCVSSKWDILAVSGTAFHHWDAHGSMADISHGWLVQATHLWLNIFFMGQFITCCCWFVKLLSIMIVISKVYMPPTSNMFSVYR